MKKTSANMRVWAVIWDLECKAMSQACWLHCCRCKLTQRPQMRMYLSLFYIGKPRTGRRSSIWRGKLKTPVWAFTSSFISSKNKRATLLCGCDRIIIIKRTTWNVQKWVKASRTQKVSLFGFKTVSTCRFESGRLKNMNFRICVYAHLNWITTSRNSRHGNYGSRWAV